MQRGGRSVCTRGSWLLPESHRASEGCLRPSGLNHPRAGRSEGCVETAGTVDRASAPRTGGPARSPATADKGLGILGMLPRSWQAFLHSAPISDSVP